MGIKGKNAVKLVYRSWKTLYMLHLFVNFCSKRLDLKIHNKVGSFYIQGCTKPFVVSEIYFFLNIAIHIGEG